MLTQKSFTPSSAGSLYLVPTPIGNLDDMTFRAVQILKKADLILAEDTRNTQKLLNHFAVDTKQMSFHEHNTQERIPAILEMLADGRTIAQVSDAGMPSISDPGKELVQAAVKAGLKVIPLPGANAGTTALIASGLAPQPFTFYGFLARKPKEQQAELEKLKNHPDTLIFYEAPHRLAKTVKNIATVMGTERQMVLARELTKRYEEFIRGSVAEVQEWIASTEIRGEFVVMVAGNPHPQAVENQDWESLTINEHVQKIIDEEKVKPTIAIKQVAKLRGLAKQEVYDIYHQL
ncbi:16S rRNA (cytidine(1402)-2'-O)-methyltransferase [Pediococcus acidilactici]|uniref:16S rRNA (cytidine(1402)-2'-O)-methyltransferase n=1 Tax=Pediococcus acidilactici TaxID=1254 RepID=UPI0022E6152A|nr:16S rRNA (cytidine(1402)-2'-O)-methyltransferase [Pediococcus acidilactici]MCI1276156.1 16S rRNA (cytidine(1402)-2'-O)-methyltransferase [Pediococcus acidilactici]MDB8859479.1 16S rRNA (cytidine(1402)-2'-O)-methyltransferase [Pediococcus acidilactici]MDB8861583.1 16S rRNA (cytidine(1402)-2'-O)-methyltransferase [Pediococcus acidilactici]MDB8863570.1 16S rRNA (cytidine(1402)-2'-O)-methyltransferase [Pediococcus acidilactici]MDB8866539.1 16S rRNA (cytidine(1402)-2'-O)-methyltransferase [Pedio